LNNLPATLQRQKISSIALSKTPSYFSKNDRISKILGGIFKIVKLKGI